MNYQFLAKFFPLKVVNLGKLSSSCITFRKNYSTLKHVAKVGIFKKKVWLNLVEIKLIDDTNVVFSFFNARVVLNNCSLLTQNKTEYPSVQAAGLNYKF